MRIQDRKAVAATPIVVIAVGAVVGAGAGSYSVLGMSDLKKVLHLLLLLHTSLPRCRWLSATLGRPFHSEIHLQPQLPHPYPSLVDPSHAVLGNTSTRMMSMSMVLDSLDLGLGLGLGLGLSRWKVQLLELAGRMGQMRMNIDSDSDYVYDYSVDVEMTSILVLVLVPPRAVVACTS